MDFSVQELIEFDLKGFVEADEENRLPSWKSYFWETVENMETGLSGAIGLYVFIIENGANLVPWYVGKTWAAGGFKHEVFQDHKKDHYKSLEHKKGAKNMLFIPLRTESGKLSQNKTVGGKEIEWVEKRLITYALDRNEDLLNTHDTSYNESVFVPGVLGTRRIGRPGPDARLTRNVFLGEPLYST